MVNITCLPPVFLLSPAAVLASAHLLGGGAGKAGHPLKSKHFYPDAPFLAGAGVHLSLLSVGCPPRGCASGRHSLQLTFVFSPQGNNRTSKQPPGPCLAEQRTWHDPFSLAICSAPFVTERGLRGKAEKPTAQIHPRRRPPAPARPDRRSP